MRCFAGVQPLSCPGRLPSVAPVGRAESSRSDLAGVGTPRGVALMIIGGEPPFPLAARAAEVEGLAAACGRASYAAFITAATRLIGVGSGLTPSGDDFVGGALFALRLLHPHDRGWRDAAREVTALAKRQNFCEASCLSGCVLANLVI